MGRGAFILASALTCFQGTAALGARLGAIMGHRREAQQQMKGALMILKFWWVANSAM